MKRDYWAIYHPEHGYYLGKKPKFGNFRYGARYVFGYNLRPTLYKDPTAATAAFNAIPAEARKGAMVVVCSVEFPYEPPAEKDDLFNKEVE